jgi:antitoxin component of RelBE/YafQ-DinJ toxin-antitoxin module
MNTTFLHIKIEPDIKREAQKTAEDLGLSLSAVTKALLKNFVRTKRLSVGVSDLPEVPNAYLRKILEDSEKETGEKGITFKNHSEALSYLDSLIEHDRPAK